MDSIELLKATAGKFGQQCKVEVSTGDIFSGIFRGYAESTPQAPLVLRLELSHNEAERIGVGSLHSIGVPYDVIKNIQF